MDLSKVSIGIKTFLRDAQLFQTISDITRTMPEARMVIADCGDMSDEKDGIYADMVRLGHTILDLPFDAGFGRMSNAIIDSLKTPYLLVASDDFDFSPTSAREGVTRLVEVLDLNLDVDIASGRVNNRRYEYDLIDEGDVVTEELLDYVDKHYAEHLWFTKCDLTVNYSLIRREVFDKVRWIDAAKIGQSDHAGFFIACKRNNFSTVYVTGVNINEQQVESSDRYKQYRARANDPGRMYLGRLGVKRYIMANGRFDYDKKD